MLGHYLHIEHIPDDAREWQVDVRGASALAGTLAGARPEALLYRKLATLRRDVPLSERLGELEWHGPDLHALRELAADLGDDRIVELAVRAQDKRG